MFFRQIAFWMLEKPDIYYPIVQDKLNGESYSSYCNNIFFGKRYMTDCLAFVAAKMWNVPISYVIPFCESVNCFHDSPNPKIVIVYNGGPHGTELECTHTCTTTSRRSGVKVGDKLVGNVPLSMSSTDQAAKECARAVERRLKKKIITRWTVVKNLMEDLEEEMEEVKKSFEKAKVVSHCLDQELIKLEANIDKLEADRKIKRERKKADEAEAEKERELRKETRKMIEETEDAAVGYVEEKVSDEYMKEIFG